MTNPYVFVVGCPRSGTTLFRHILDAHPQIAITPEAHWVPSTVDPAWRPITAGLRDRRTQMSAEDVERFEAVAGKLLDELDYPRGLPHPRPESLESASKIRNLLAQDLYRLTLSKKPVRAAPLGMRQRAEANEARGRVEF